MMDFPCTQQLPCEFDESFASDEGEKKQIGFLVVEENKKLSLSSSKFPLFEGENIIGRHEDCDIFIPKGLALSKKHACIEAKGDSSYLFDCGSSNKTRLGSLRLKPEVRYCLQDGDSITFANVKCFFEKVQSTDDLEDGSDSKNIVSELDKDISTPVQSACPQLLAADTPETLPKYNQFKQLNLSLDTEVVPDSQQVDESLVDMECVFDSDRINAKIDDNSDTDIDEASQCSEELITESKMQGKNLNGEDVEEETKPTSCSESFAENETQPSFSSTEDLQLCKPGLEDTLSTLETQYFPSNIGSKAGTVEQTKVNIPESGSDTDVDEDFSMLATVETQKFPLGNKPVSSEEKQCKFFCGAGGDSSNVYRKKSANKKAEEKVAPSYEEEEKIWQSAQKESSQNLSESLSEDTLSVLETQTFPRSDISNSKADCGESKLKNQQENDSDTDVEEYSLLATAETQAFLQQAAKSTEANVINSSHNETITEAIHIDPNNFKNEKRQSDCEMVGSVDSRLPLHDEHESENQAVLKEKCLHTVTEDSLSMLETQDVLPSPILSKEKISDVCEEDSSDTDVDEEYLSLAEAEAQAYGPVWSKDKVISKELQSNNKSSKTQAKSENEGCENTEDKRLVSEKLERLRKTKLVPSRTDKAEELQSRMKNNSADVKTNSKTPLDVLNTNRSTRIVDFGVDPVGITSDTLIKVDAGSESFATEQVSLKETSHVDDNINAEKLSFHSSSKISIEKIDSPETKIPDVDPNNQEEQDADKLLEVKSILSKSGESSIASNEPEVKTCNKIIIPLSPSIHDESSGALESNSSLNLCPSGKSIGKASCAAAASSDAMTRDTVCADTTKLIPEVCIIRDLKESTKTVNKNVDSQTENAVETKVDISSVSNENVDWSGDFAATQTYTGVRETTGSVEVLPTSQVVDNDFMVTQAYCSAASDNLPVTSQESSGPNASDMEVRCCGTVEEQNSTLNVVAASEEPPQIGGELHNEESENVQGDFMSTQAYSLEADSNEKNLAFGSTKNTTNVCEGLSSYNFALSDSEIFDAGVVSDDDIFCTPHQMAESQNEEYHCLATQPCASDAPAVQQQVNKPRDDEDDLLVPRPSIDGFQSPSISSTSPKQVVENKNVMMKDVSDITNVSAHFSTEDEGIVDVTIGGRSLRKRRGVNAKMGNNDYVFSTAKKRKTRKAEADISKENMALPVEKSKVMPKKSVKSKKPLDTAFPETTSSLSLKSNSPRAKEKNAKRMARSRKSKVNVNNPDHSNYLPAKLNPMEESIMVVTKSDEMKSPKDSSNAVKMLAGPACSTKRTSSVHENSHTDNTESPKQNKRKQNNLTSPSCQVKLLKMEKTDALVSAAALALRPRKVKPKVMFTGVVDKIGEKMVKDLGGQLSDDIMEECSHLVTDKIRRTVKFLCAVARGIFILNQEWLRESQHHKRFLSEEGFELCDATLSQCSIPSPPATSLEDLYDFNLSTSLSIARSRPKPLLEGKRIHVTKSVLPPPDQMYQIISCCGGESVRKMPRGEKLKDLIVVSTDEDKRFCASAIKANVPLVSKEYILTGVLRQKLQLDCFRLFDEPLAPEKASSTKARSKQKKASPLNKPSTDRSTRATRKSSRSRRTMR